LVPGFSFLSTTLSLHPMLVRPRDITSTPSILDASNSDPEAEARLIATLQLIGSMTVGGIFYGFTTATATLSASSIIQSSQHRSRRRIAFLLAYVGLLWASGTLDMAGITWSGVATYVYQTSVPNKAMVYMTNNSYWAILLLSDAMMVWRFKVVWSKSAYYRYLIIVPVLGYLGILVPGFFVFVLLDDGAVWEGPSVGAALISTVFLSSFCLNVYVAALISGRLLLYRRRFKTYLGSPDAKHYTSYGAILVESYLPLALGNIVFFVLYFLDNPAQWVMASIVDQMQIIASFLVMVRVSRGIAWDASMTPQSVDSAIDRALEAVLGQ